MPFLVGQGSLLISSLKMLLPLSSWDGLQFFSFQVLFHVTEFFSTYVYNN